MKYFLTICLLLSLPILSYTQTTDSLPIQKYAEPAEFEIGGIKVTGAQFSDENAIIAITGLKVGAKIRIPGPEVTKAIKALWKLRLFTGVQINKEKTIGDVIFLEIVVTERPSLSVFSYKGAKKSQHDDLNAVVNRFLLKGAIVTESNKVNAANGIEKFYREKGYLDAKVKVEEIPDNSHPNSVRLVFDVEKNKRVKIQNITFSGNANAKSGKLRRKMDKTHRKWKIFSSSKLVRDEYEEDKKAIVKYYNTIGYRDARIVSDSIWREKDGDLQIHINIEEGTRYYFRNIAWKGNSIYDSKVLSNVLGITKGDVYNQELLQTRLSFSQDGRDVSSLYMDNGYLFFNVDPVEVAVNNDSIDLEMRIFEGPQATIDRVVIKGNDRTHEHVIRRELHTRPGEKFSRSDIIRSQREIVNLGYFNPENLGINTPVNRQRGTVDIEYTVEEKPSDQLELSAGWGGYGVVGTLGVSFNNFSIRNILKKESWSPLPQGDGQRLSLRAQTNGKYFQSYNLSFTEPWLGGKKANSFTVGGAYSRYTNGYDSDSPSYGSFSIINGYVSLGTRMKWPDDNFISNTTLDFQDITLKNWTGGFFTVGENLTNGFFNNLSINETVTRNSVSEPIYPRSGSRISLSVQLTPPYSAIGKLFGNEKDYANLGAGEKYKWLEYHKWRFNAEWYVSLIDKLVLKTSAKIGMLGYYNSKIGLSPFERFVLGGDGLSNQNVGLTGNDIISMRGYDTSDLPASDNGGASVFDKFTVELRYPVSLNPSSTIYVLAFGEGGNSWRSFRDFNPFDIRRSTGLGLRVFLPMFGTLGFDYGIGFDKPSLIAKNAKWTEFGRFNIILGFEPE